MVPNNRWMQCELNKKAMDISDELTSICHYCWSRRNTICCPLSFNVIVCWLHKNNKVAFLYCACLLDIIYHLTPLYCPALYVELICTYVSTATSDLQFLHNSKDCGTVICKTFVIGFYVFLCCGSNMQNPKSRFISIFHISGLFRPYFDQENLQWIKYFATDFLLI